MLTEEEEQHTASVMRLLILSQPVTGFSQGISSAVSGFRGFSRLHCLSSMNSSRLTVNLCKEQGKGIECCSWGAQEASLT